VIVSGFMTSIQGIFKYIADPYNDLPSIVYWALGSLGPVKTKDILAVGPVIVLAMAASRRFAEGSTCSPSEISRRHPWG
jgi:iron complex transport system permease protein